MCRLIVLDRHHSDRGAHISDSADLITSSLRGENLFMNTSMKFKAALSAFAFLFVLTLAVSTNASAQSLKVKGVIISRAGNTMTLKTADGQTVVVLNDTTDVQQLQGALKARKKELSLIH